LKLQIEHIDQKDLHLNDENVNVHNSKSLEKIANSLKEFGFINPIVIDDNNIVIAGNGRLEASRRLKIDSIPCIRAKHLSEVQLRAFAIADNRVAEESFFADDLLKGALEELENANYNLDVLGFDSVEIENIFNFEHELETEEPTSKDKEEKVCPHCGEVL
jgi:ParB-like chromosome segregation protein Spo0J